VLTVHDVFPLCPNHSLLYGQSLREDLFKNKTYNCVRYKCIDNRLLPSIAGTLEAYYYRLKGVWEHVDIFICPSQFMMDKMAEYGFPKNKLRVVVNPFELRTDPLPLGNRVVYLGRMHYEKGIRLFLEAATHLRDVPMTVAGSGPDDKWVDTYIKQYSLTQVERLHWVDGQAWQKVMASAKVVVVPSVFYENCSLTVLEALSYGRIVVGVNRGGTPEMIIDGQTGFLAKPENADDLASVIRKAFQLSEQESKQMVERARKRVAGNHAPDDYFKKLENIYSEVVKK
jgi:glycosyltransferase involved in cell wall biosynthesis